ncbi:MAG: 4-hydroxyphenylacetate 3-hydroxylase family protein [Hyphomonadaceae bacterium JAD_PAG50586_4]|nr:MAG: 4-hydroxyphenylacetate 3-hydroxylase family protein [Hyphomonadaceae bacterium JAD_PAG50586_4]
MTIRCRADLDENDAVIFFDDVKIPWDRVFCSRDVVLSNKMFHATPAHILQNYQAQIRLAVKLRFLVGLARRIAEANGATDFPQVRETLGQLAAEASMVEALVAAMEARGELVNGYFTPHRNTVYTAQVLTQQLYPKIINTLRDLSGGGVIMLPSGVEDLLNREFAGYALAAQRSPVFSPEDRVRFFKLAWDAIGSEFASRHTQYEMFYAGASFVTKGHAFRTFDWARANALVDQLWNSYPRAIGEMAHEPARKVGA